MPKKINTINLLKAYIQGVETRANHHANSVNEVIYALVGFIVRYKDDKDIEIKSENSEMKNVLWLSIKDKRYAFSYNHENGKIEMRENSLKGNTIFQFDNNSNIKGIKEFFESL
ncbi:MAG: hypothetical protein ABF289_11845 [Clostridiales bacterium]